MTALFDGREAGIIKAGISPDTSDGIYSDEGIFAFQVPSVPLSDFASQVLTYDVENELGTNPVWVRIRLTDGAKTTYQFVPTSNPLSWHTVNAAAGDWYLMDINGNATGPARTLTQVATDNPGLAVDRVYLALGMGNSYNVSPGVGTVGWVDKVVINTTTYDFVVPTKWYVAKTGLDTNEGTLASPFLTISHAISVAAQTGDTIHVAAGTYNESIIINKSLTVLGAQADVNPIDGGRTGGESQISSSYAVKIDASDVIFNGFELADFRYGIDVDHDETGYAAPDYTLQNITVSYNWIHAQDAWVGFTTSPGLLKNFLITHNIIDVNNVTPGGDAYALSAIGFSSGTSPSGHPTYENIEISYNDLRNLSPDGGYTLFSGADPGAYLINGMVINGNCFRNVPTVGANLNIGNILNGQFTNNLVEDIGGTIGIDTGTISGNTFRNGAYLALWGNEYGFTRPSRNLTVFNNDFTDEVYGRGFRVRTGADPTTIQVTNNFFRNSGINPGDPTPFGPPWDGYVLINQETGGLNAINNWWGASTGPITGRLSGTLTTSPWITSFTDDPAKNVPPSTLQWPLSTMGLTRQPGFWPTNVVTNVPQPPLPSSFWGYFKFYDGAPTSSSLLTANIDDMTGPAASVYVINGSPWPRYAFNVPGDLAGTPDKEGGVEDDVITFKIGDRIVGTGVWHGGTNVQLDFDPPQAVPGGPYYGLVGASISLNGSANDWGVPPETLSFAWNLDSNPDYETPGQNISQSWPTVGDYTIGLQVTDSHGGVGTATTTVHIASITLGSLSQTYDGTAKAATATTNPPGLTVNFAYTPDDPPVNVGSYGVTATIAGYIGSVTGTLVITPATATIVSVGNLNPVAPTGPFGVTVTTSPSGVLTTATYTGVGIVYGPSTTPPTTPGTYSVVVAITDPNYTGSSVTVTMHIQTTCDVTGLVAGWNLVSLCLAPVNTTPGTVLNSLSGSYDLVYGWDGSVASNNWLKFAPGGPGYANNMTSLNEKMGFWVHMTGVGPLTLAVTGYPPVSTSIPLSIVGGGWNLVGYPSLTPMALAGTLHDFTLIYAYHAGDTSIPFDPWKLYDVAAPAPWVSDLQSLTKNWGYWIYVTSTYSWTVTY